MRRLLFTLAFAALTGLAAPARGQDWGWVLSIPYALSQEQIYKVRLLDIDGAPQKELLRYAVAPGEHTLTVQMMLDVEWEPDLSESARQPPVKRITLNVERGRTYQLAARVDIEAPIEAQLDQSYWEPFLYRVD